MITCAHCNYDITDKYTAGVVTRTKRAENNSRWYCENCENITYGSNVVLREPKLEDACGEAGQPPLTNEEISLVRQLIAEREQPVPGEDEVKVTPIPDPAPLTASKQKTKEENQLAKPPFILPITYVEHLIPNVSAGSLLAAGIPLEDQQEVQTQYLMIGQIAVRGHTCIYTSTYLRVLGWWVCVNTLAWYKHINYMANVSWDLPEVADHLDEHPSLIKAVVQEV